MKKTESTTFLLVDMDWIIQLLKHVHPIDYFKKRRL